MFKQISKYFEPILLKFQCSFREGFNVQHCPLHPVQVLLWPSNFLPGIKTKFKYFSGEI